LSDKDITIEIRRPETIVLLIFLLFVLYLELKTTLNSPIVFGDEGLHTRLAQYIGTEADYPKWVPFSKTKISDLAFFRPPLWNLLEGSFFFVFGFSENIVKILTPFIASILLGLSVFTLVNKIYNKRVAFISSVISVTIPSLVTYAVLFYTDALFTLYFSMFILTLLFGIQNNNKKYLMLSGIFGGFALLTKTVGLFIFPILILFFSYDLYKDRKLFDVLKKYALIGLMLFLIYGPYVLRNVVFYKIPSCELGMFEGIFSDKGCKASTLDYKQKYEFPGRTEQIGTEMNVLQMGVLNYLDFAYGSIWIIVFGFIGGIFVLIRNKEHLDILLLTLIIVFIPVFYMGMGRAEDTARYTLGWVPIIGLVAAKYFDEIYIFIKNYNKQLALIVFVAIVVYSLFGHIIGTSGYGVINKLAGLRNVKQFSPLFLEACDWIKNNTPTNSLISTVWVYHTIYNCQRNAMGNLPDVAMSNDLNISLSALNAYGVNYIFIQKFSLGNQALSEKYPISQVQFLDSHPENFKKVYENGPDLKQCLQQGGCDGNIVYEVVLN